MVLATEEFIDQKEAHKHINKRMADTFIKVGLGHNRYPVRKKEGVNSAGGGGREMLKWLFLK